MRTLRPAALWLEAVSETPGPSPEVCAARGQGAWYSFAASPRAAGARILLGVDESSYSPRMRLPWFLGGTRQLAMGADHPVAWTRCAGRGRAFYSALGYAAAAYESAELQALLEGATAWAARLEGEGCQ